MKAIKWWESLTLDQQIWVLGTYPTPEMSDCDSVSTITVIHQRHELLEHLT